MVILEASTPHLRRSLVLPRPNHACNKKLGPPYSWTHILNDKEEVTKSGGFASVAIQSLFFDDSGQQKDGGRMEGHLVPKLRQIKR